MLNSITFQKEVKRGRHHDPRRNFELTAVESEIRYDPLTGDSGRICHFLFNPFPPAHLDELIAQSAVNCPFCPGAVDTLTPRFPNDLIAGQRLRYGGAVLFPNLFPYDDISAVAVLGGQHFYPMDDIPAQIIEDGIGTARSFFRTLENRAGAEAPGFGIVVWNYMPPAGASQVHPHMQVIYTTNPGSRMRRELIAERAYLERYGRTYQKDLLAVEQADGSRFIMETGSVPWYTPFVPTGLLGDCMAVFPGKATVGDLDDRDIADFALGLRRLLRGFASLGAWSFNLVFFPARSRADADSHWLTAQLVPRLFLNPLTHVSDVAYLQLLMGERLSMTYPESNAARLKGPAAG